MDYDAGVCESAGDSGNPGEYVGGCGVERQEIIDAVNFTEL